MAKRYNWRPDLGDQRDFLYKKVRLKSTPTKVDLRSLCPPVVDQGQIGSCTGNALAGTLGFLELRELKQSTDKTFVFDPTKFLPLSRLFIYYNERVIEGDPGQDGGAEIRDGIKTLNKAGACTEVVWPYVSSKALKKPTASAYTQASSHKISSYTRITTLAGMKNCLASGFPFVFGFTVYESFESSYVASSGIVPMPKKGEKVLGGHAVMAVGYDDSKSMFLVRNSWGTGWGQKGYFWMPYAYVGNTNLADDFWTIRK